MGCVNSAVHHKTFDLQARPNIRNPTRGRERLPPEERAAGATLVAAVRATAAGETHIAPSIVERMVSEFVRRPPPGSSRPAALDELTDSEIEVLKLVARGLTNAEIANALFLGETTGAHSTSAASSGSSVCATGRRPRLSRTRAGSSSLAERPDRVSQARMGVCCSASAAVTRSSHGVASSRSKISRASARPAASPCSSRVTASQKDIPRSRNRCAAAS